MGRYMGTLIIEFTDGSTQRVSGNRHRVSESVLTIWTEGAYNSSGHKYFPLSNIKLYYWENE